MDPKPSIGRIVHFRPDQHMADTALIEGGRIGRDPLPAVIVRVHNDTEVDLQILGPVGMPFRRSVFMGTGELMWSWPPRV